MANTRFTQFMYTKHGKPVVLDVDIPIGSTGAVGTIVGAGISAVTRLSAGVYKIRFNDNYNKYIGSFVDVFSPVSGSAVGVASLVSGTVYQITTVGNTDWTAITGWPAGMTAAVGVVFVPTGVGSGTGFAKAIGVSGISVFEVAGVPNTMLYPGGSASSIGGYVVVQCLAATSSSVTTLIPTDPASGSTLSVAIYLDDSSNNILNNG